MVGLLITMPIIERTRPKIKSIMPKRKPVSGNKLAKQRIIIPAIIRRMPNGIRNDLCLFS